MSVYRATDGTVLAVSQLLLGEDNAPLVPKAGYPKVYLKDSDGDTVVSATASAGTQAGQWTANIAIPMIGVSDATEFSLKWLLKDTEGGTTRHYDAVIISPKSELRDGDVVILMGDEEFEVTCPEPFASGYTGKYDIFFNNDKIATGDLTDNAVEKSTSLKRTVFTIPLDPTLIVGPSLSSYVVNLRVKPPGGKSRMFTYLLWIVTGTMQRAMAHVESFLNKSKIENTIPQLKYTDGDLMNYLERGLYMFNRVGYPTSFTGTNMQGVLYDSWMICATYYALGAQLIAEGSLSFDYTGQSVSLNIDRTPQLESALGRIESLIEGQIVPLKKVLANNGQTGGDGSVGGGSLNTPSALGRLGVINAPTTRLPVANGGVFIGKRYTR